jgi:putative ABC transport system permease protein
MSRVLRIALRNVFRHPRRTMITCSAVALGVAFMVVAAGFLSFTFWGLRQAIVYGGLGHLQILPSRVDARARLSASAADDVTALLRGSPAVTVVAPRVEFQGLVSAGPRTLTFSGIGVEAFAESQLRSLTMLTAGQWFTGRERVSQVLVGGGLADRLHVRPRAMLTLIAYSDRGSMSATDVQVAGIFESGVLEYDARTLLLPIEAARELMQTSGTSSLAVLLRDAGETDDVVLRLRSGLIRRGIAGRVAPWDELSPVYASVVRLYRWILDVFLVIITLVVILGIANTMSMAVFERGPEIGMLRALGFGSWCVLTMFVTEAATIGAIGAIGGVGLGAGACIALSALGIDMPPPPGHSQGYVAQVRIVPEAFATAVAIAVAAAILAAIVPSLRAIHREVSDVLRAT